LANFCSAIWRLFIRQFGKFSIGNGARIFTEVISTLKEAQSLQNVFCVKTKKGWQPSLFVRYSLL